jgi:hypothetical protein
MSIQPDHIGGDRSFVIYEATVTMGSIFLGFVFAALLALLTTADALSTPQLLAVWLLSLALACFWVGLLLFHLSAHSVVRYCGYFFPRSKLLLFGGPVFSAAQLLMFWSIAAMLLFKEQLLLGVFLFAFAPVAILLYLYKVKSIHSGGQHVVDVDRKSLP